MGSVPLSVRAESGSEARHNAFADLGRPDRAAGWVGAHSWHYFETYYFGNPGNYQTFVYSINDAGVGSGASFELIGYTFS